MYNKAKSFAKVSRGSPAIKMSLKVKRVDRYNSHTSMCESLRNKSHFYLFMYNMIFYITLSSMSNLTLDYCDAVSEIMMRSRNY